MPSTPHDAPMTPDWNFHPDLPPANPSIFRWPPDPCDLAGWMACNWLTLSERVILVGIAVLAWALFYPALDRAAT